MGRRMVVGIAVVLGLFVLACGSTPTPAANAPTAAPTRVGAIGERVEQNGVALTVIKMEQKAEIDQFQKATTGNVFLVAEVLIENSGVAKAPYNPLYFTVKDGDGFEYNAALVAGDSSLKSGELAQGEKARGVVAFEVKQDAKGIVLSYKPLVFGADEAIRVALK